jgi:beta-phosphoglucomutase
MVAELLNLNPEECVVIEDAPNGIESAKNGGIKCIAITTTHEKSELGRADKIIDSFDELVVSELINL